MIDGFPDCLIIGAGPAGLTAAIYLRRFLLNVELIDAGASRAALIPRTHNHAGFPGGISGVDLLARMHDQASLYGARVRPGFVQELYRSQEGFTATGEGVSVRARTVLLATGVTNRRPEMPDDLHAAALAQGRLRYCPVCDGYEVTDQAVAVVGAGRRGANEAVFLRSFTADVTLVAPGPSAELDEDQRTQLSEVGVSVVDGPARDFRLETDGLSFEAAAGRLRFQAVYPAMGSDIHSGLAKALGAAVTDEGCVKVDAHQRSTVPGLYAAGDVVIGLDQISHAMGEAGVAATAIRNDLAALAPRLRAPVRAR